MTDRETPPPDDETRWAPWWVYLVVLLGANYIRAFVLPGDSLPLPVVVVIAVGQAALLFGLVTVVWRVLRR